MCKYEGIIVLNAMWPPVCMFTDEVCFKDFVSNDFGGWKSVEICLSITM